MATLWLSALCPSALVFGGSSGKPRHTVSLQVLTWVLVLLAWLLTCFCWGDAGLKDLCHHHLSTAGPTSSVLPARPPLPPARCVIGLPVVVDSGCLGLSFHVLSGMSVGNKNAFAISRTRLCKNVARTL